MVDPFYTRSRATAERLIAKYGQPGFLRVRAAGSGGDPWNPSAPGAATDVPIKFVLDEFTAQERDGTSISMTDKRAIISTEGLEVVEPDAAMEMLIGGKSHGIANLSPLTPGGLDILYTAQVSM